MGIVAGDTTDARIGSAEAFAVSQPVRLEAHVEFATPRAANHGLPTAMALSTEIRKVFRGELSQIRRSHLRNCPCVTVLACDTGLKGAESQQVSIPDRAGGMAAKAGYRFFGGKPSPHRFVKIFRSSIRIADRDAESVNGRVVTDEAFIVDAVALKHPGLRAIAKTPADREGHSLSSVAHGISALTILGLYNVGIAKFLKCKSWVGIQYCVGARQLQCASHGRKWLRLRLGGMATCTGECRVLHLFLPCKRVVCGEQEGQSCRELTKDAQSR